MNNITVREWQKRHLDDIELTANDRKFLNKLDEQGYLSFREFGRRAEIETNRYVGLIQLENCALRIEPKIENHRLLWMIDYGSRLNCIRTFDIEVPAKEGDFTLPDLIFFVFLSKVDQILRQGLHKNYITIRGRQTHLKGKLLLYDNIVRNHHPSVGICVEHDELTYDILENRVIMAALRIVRRFSRRRQIRLSAQRCLSAVFPVVSDVQIKPYDCKHIGFNRLNKHYESAINLARLILEYIGLEEINQSGRARICSFLVNMDSIFQEFLNRLLAEHLSGIELLKQPQYSQFIKERESGRSRYVQPDFVLVKKARNNKTGLLVADAKYKTNYRPSVSDLYQIFFYSLAITGSRGLAYLIYPGSVRSKQITLDLRSKGSPEIQTTVKVIRLPLLRIINLLSSGRSREVKALLRDLFQVY